jgi:hypothetical protein
LCEERDCLDDGVAGFTDRIVFVKVAPIEKKWSE